MWRAIRVTQQRREHCTKQSLEIFRELGDRWGIAGTLADLGNLASEQGNYSMAQDLVPAEHQNLPGTGTQARNCAAAGVFRVLGGGATGGERSLRLAGAAAALAPEYRRAAYSGRTSQTGSHLHTGAAGVEEYRQARRPGQKVGLCRSEKAIEEVLMLGDASRSCS